LCLRALVIVICRLLLLVAARLDPAGQAIDHRRKVQPRTL